MEVFLLSKSDIVFCTDEGREWSSLGVQAQDLYISQVVYKEKHKQNTGMLKFIIS